MDMNVNPELLLKGQDFCEGVMRKKYALEGETSAYEIRQRVANDIGTDEKQARYFLEIMEQGFVPGGRINRAAGGTLKTTMINCFVQPVGDTMSGKDKNGVIGIMDSLLEAAETMRLGGGVGYDFSPIRPAGALVKGTSSRASGPVSFMRIFDRACETVESAGARRGAQMGVLRCDHPDIEKFIDAKKTPDFKALGLDAKENDVLLSMIKNKPEFGWACRKAFATLSNFNLSVGVTDEFMEAVVADTSFDLVHEADPATDVVTVKHCADGKTRFIYRTVKARDIWDKIMRNTYESGEPGVIFIDRVNKDNNLGYVERIAACNPCGEQFLPPYGCCCLGSIMLQRFVIDAFEPGATFNWPAFRKAIRGGVEFLDRVLDKTNWPLPEQNLEAVNKRRIGLGYLGLADAMAKLGIRYNSAAAIAFTKEVTTVLRDTAYAKSAELAEELGPFPLFDADKYLQEGTFASRLAPELKDKIRRHGIRNSHLLSIAPTGTIALAFGDNASSGIEPIFSVRQRRTMIMEDGSREEFDLDNAAYREFLQSGRDPAETDVFVSALQMSVDDHLKIVEAAAPLIDSAISKTVNVPADYPFADFVNLYQRAWTAGLKGITTYRPNVMVGTVLADAGADKSKDDLRIDDPDRRIELKDASDITSALRWPNRPLTPHGTESVTYTAEHPQGDFAVVVGLFSNGKKHPLEVYIAGNEQPRGLAAIAKVLSVDMRTGDAKWLRMKLESLANTEADDAFDMHDPATGNLIRVPSLVSGFSRLVSHQLESIGALEGDGDSVMVNSLFSKKEPKTGPMGAIGWHVDLRNDVTGDDFLMHTKEVRLEDGTIRPYSVWLSGKYPQVLNGLAKLLSIDMRVSNPAWVIMKLRKLLKFGEQRGDFLAQVPGQQRQMNYPSTVAYMAAVLLDRYRVLGLDGGMLDTTGESQPKTEVVAGQAAIASGTGALCPSCLTMNLHKRDGCKTCDHPGCGYVGECG